MDESNVYIQGYKEESLFVFHNIEFIHHQN